MERAPGQELHDLLQLPSAKFNRLEHVDAIAEGLYQFLQRTTERNFIHRDIKPQNLLYDPATKEMTVIDAGIGGVYAKPGKSPERAPNANPSVSRMGAGTRFYITQSMAEGEDYGNEVDFHSSALTLLEVLNPVELSRAVRILAGKKPREFVTSTAILRKVLEKNNPLIKALNDRPDLEKKINLFFEVAHAANKEDRQKAYQRLQSAMTNTPLPEALQERAPNLGEATDYEAFRKFYGF